MVPSNYKERPTFQVVLDLCAGLSKQEICAKYGLTYNDLHKIIKKASYGSFALLTSGAVLPLASLGNPHRARAPILKAYTVLDELMADPRYIAAVDLVRSLEADAVLKIEEHISAARAADKPT